LRCGVIEIRVRVRFGNGWDLEIRRSFRFGVIEIRVRVRFGNGWDLEIRRSFRFGVIEIRDPTDSGSFRFGDPEGWGI